MLTWIIELIAGKEQNAVLIVLWIAFCSTGLFSLILYLCSVSSDFQSMLGQSLVVAPSAYTLAILIYPIKDATDYLTLALVCFAFNLLLCGIALIQRAKRIDDAKSTNRYFLGRILIVCVFAFLGCVSRLTFI